jgi:hypothetical protein
MSSDEIEKLTILAKDFGPFMFAILFAIFVPFLSHKWYNQSLERTSPPASDAEKKTYRIYFISSIVAGFVLITATTAWWFYENMQKNHVYQVTIKGLGEKESIDSDYYHMSILRNPSSGMPKTHDYYFVVVQKEPFNIGQIFDVRYLGEKAVENSRLGEAIMPNILKIKYSGAPSGVFKVGADQDGNPILVASKDKTKNTLFAKIDYSVYGKENLVDGIKK